MKLNIAILLFAFMLSFGGNIYAQKVSVTPKKVTYTRKNPQSEYKKTFTITYPIVKARTPALSKKIEAALSYEKAFDFTIKEELADAEWLEDASYQDVFNSGNILSMSLFIEGSAAYPDTSTKFVVVDTSTGVAQTPQMVFTNTAALVAMVSHDLKKEIAQSIKDIKADKENNEENPEELFTESKFTAANLKGFSVSSKGVTFHYDYEFPHVIQAIQPLGEFTYSWAAMKKYLKPGGSLAAMGH